MLRSRFMLACAMLTALVSISGLTTAATPPVSKTPTTTPAPERRPELRRGSSGAAVKELQRLLNAWRPSAPDPRPTQLVVDGVFGARTETVVRAFQRAARLTADGIVGKQTWKRLLADASPVPATSPTPTVVPTAEPLELLPGTSRGEYGQPDLKPVLDLSMFGSYRRGWTARFDGKDAEGRGVYWQQETSEALIRASRTQLLVTMHAEPEGATIHDVTYRRGAAIYGQRNEEHGPTCRAGYVAPDEPLAPFAPVDGEAHHYFADFGPLHLVRRGEIVNGIRTIRYHAPEATTPFWAGMTAVGALARGDLWIAENGGYLVRYAAEATISPEQAVERSAPYPVLPGTYRWEYNVEQLNKLAEIPLPVACAGVEPEPTPLMPLDATNFNGLRYQTRLAQTDLVDFYMRSYPAIGWALASRQSLPEQEQLSFTRRTSTFSVAVMHDPEPPEFYNGDKNEVPPPPPPDGAETPPLEVQPRTGSLVQILELRSGEPVVEVGPLPTPPGVRFVEVTMEGVHARFTFRPDQQQPDQELGSRYRETMRQRGWTQLCMENTTAETVCPEFRRPTKPGALVDFYHGERDGRTLTIQVVIADGGVTIYPIGHT